MEGELAPLLVRGIKAGELDAKRAELSVETELLKGTRFLNSLDTVANISPMLGLLGTVWGMLITLQTIANNQGGVVPAQLASGPSARPLDQDWGRASHPAPVVVEGQPPLK